MSMIDEETAYEFAAVIEETEKQLRGMQAKLPAQICATVADAIARTGRVEALAKQTAALEQASANTVRASEHLLAGVKKASKIAIAIILLIPLMLGITFVVQRYRLSSAIGTLQSHIQGLQGLAANLRPGNPDGLELVDYGGGEKGIILPKGASISYSAPIQDGREAIVFTP